MRKMNLFSGAHRICALTEIESGCDRTAGNMGLNTCPKPAPILGKCFVVSQWRVKAPQAQAAAAI